MHFNLLFKVGIFSVIVGCLMVLSPTDAYSALPKKKLEIIIGGDNFCKDDKDCAGESFCHMTSHICIACPKPFEWVGGTECVCPDGTVPNADNTDCVECTGDNHCEDLKGNLHWTCDTTTNTCECLSGLHEESGQCVCDNANKKPDVDGNCICQLDQADCPDTDFTDNNDCRCCPADTPKWDGLECRTCEDIDTTKPYYNLETKTCEACPEPTPSWNSETQACECPSAYGAIQGMGDGTFACLPYCEEQEIGLIMFIDRSSSTRDTGYEKYINSALASITVPDVYRVAAFLDRGEKQLTAYQILPYDFYTNEQIQATVQKYTLRSKPSGTTFYGSLKYVLDNICTGDERFLMAMWTDASLIYDNNGLVGQIKAKCPNSKFYYVSPLNNFSNADRWFNIKTLASNADEAAAYSSFLQEAIKQEGCVPRPKEETEE